jgi:hypothetical protein
MTLKGMHPSRPLFPLGSFPSVLLWSQGGWHIFHLFVCCNRYAVDALPVDALPRTALVSDFTNS